MQDNIPTTVNCPLCLEHTLQVVTVEAEKLLQCLRCGYASADKFILNGQDVEHHEEYKKLPEDMKRWSKIEMDRVWIPTILTLPTAMIFPVNENGDMKWSYANIIDVHEDEKENYKISEGEYYTQKYDTENAKCFDEFYLCLFMLTEGENGKKKIQSRIENNWNSTR